MKTQSKVVSVTHELLDLADVAGSARILAQLLAVDGLPDEQTARDTPAAIAATLCAVQARLRLLAYAIAGNRDPGLLWTPANDAGGPLRPGDDADLRLTAWPAQSGPGRATRQPVAKAPKRR